MNEMNRDELAEALADALRRLTKDALEEGSRTSGSPAGELPDAVVESFVNIVLPLLLKERQHGVPVNEGDLADLVQALMSRPEIISYLSIISLRMQQVSAVDKDLDGAIMFCRKGGAMLKSERYQQAKVFFKRATEIKKDLREAWSGLSEALECLGETDESERARRIADQL